MRYETQKHPTDHHEYVILDHDTEEATEVELPGHWLYLRLCERAEDIEGIILPQKSRDEFVTLYEVIAIGNKVGEWRPKERRFNGVFDMDRNAVLDVKVGDTVIIPAKASGEGTGYEGFVKSSPISGYEGLLDAGLILAVVRT